MIFWIIMTLISAAALVIGISDGEILGIIAGLCGVPLGIWCVIYYRKNSKKEKERNKKQNQPERQISIDMDFDYDWRLMNDRIVKGMIVECKIYLNEIIKCNCIIRSVESSIYITTPQHKDLCLFFNITEKAKALEAYHYIVDHSAMSAEEKRKAHKDILNMIALTAEAAKYSNTHNEPVKKEKKEKDASVIGRAVAGAVIAGPTGAVVGALSAVDKNNKKKKE